jgi:hypothetical protein
MYRHYQSQYKPGVSEHAPIAVRLTTDSNRNMNHKETSNPLARWMHFKNPERLFQEFRAAVLACSTLNEETKAVAARILNTAEKKSGRSLRKPGQSNGTYLEPGYCSVTARPSKEEKRQSGVTKGRTMRWICMPYFVKRSSASRTSTKKSGRGGPESAIADFEISQLWCLLTDGKSSDSCPILVGEKKLGMPLLLGLITPIWTANSHCSLLINSSPSVHEL